MNSVKIHIGVIGAAKRNVLSIYVSLYTYISKHDYVGEGGGEKIILKDGKGTAGGKRGEKKMEKDREG